MARCIKIRDWDRHFEVAQSRKIEGPLAWVAMPTKHDGKGYRRIMAHTNGPAIYAAWCVLVQIAAKQPVRGTLADADGPLTPFDVFLKSAVPESLIEDAVTYLSSKEIGWIVVEEWEPTGSRVALQNKTGQDITEHDKTGQRSSVVVDSAEVEEEQLSPSWLALVARLKAEGMDFAQQACESARGNGCIASEAEFLLNHWLASPGAWSIGVLFNKIKECRHDRKTVWPEPSAEFKKRKAAAVGDAKVAEQISNRQKIQAERDAQEIEQKKLESEHGRELDAMSSKKLRAFIEAELPPFAAMLLPTKLKLPIGGSLRSQCLRQLSRRSSVPEVPTC